MTDQPSSLYALAPLHVWAHPGVSFPDAFEEAHTLRKDLQCDVRLIFNGLEVKIRPRTTCEMAWKQYLRKTMGRKRRTSEKKMKGFSL